MSHDRSTVEAVVQHYFDGLYEGNADKLGAIFNPSAALPVHPLPITFFRAIGRYSFNPKPVFR